MMTLESKSALSGKLSSMKGISNQVSHISIAINNYIPHCCFAAYECNTLKLVRPVNNTTDIIFRNNDAIRHILTIHNYPPTFEGLKLFRKNRVLAPASGCTPRMTLFDTNMVTKRGLLYHSRFPYETFTLIICKSCLCAC